MQLAKLQELKFPLNFNESLQLNKYKNTTGKHFRMKFLENHNERYWQH